MYTSQPCAQRAHRNPLNLHSSPNCFWTFGVSFFGRSGFGRWGPTFGRSGFLDVRGSGFSDIRGSGFHFRTFGVRTLGAHFWTFGVFGRSGLGVFGRSGFGVSFFGRSGFGRWGPLFGRSGFSDVGGSGFGAGPRTSKPPTTKNPERPKSLIWTFGVQPRTSKPRTSKNPECPFPDVRG